MSSIDADEDFEGILGE